MKAKSILIYLILSFITTNAFGQLENLSFFKRTYLPEGNYDDHVERMLISIKNDAMKAVYSYSYSDGHYHAFLLGKLNGSIISGKKYSYVRDEYGEEYLDINDFKLKISSDRKKIIWISDETDNLPDFDVSKFEYSFSGSKRNFRELPNTSSKIKSKVNLDKVNVELIEIGNFEKIGKTYNFWYKIKIDNTEGWIYGGLEIGWTYNNPSQNVFIDKNTTFLVSGESRKPFLSNINDSINYTLGYWQGDVFRSNYFLDDKNHYLLEVFIKELDENFYSTPKSEMYELGFRVGEYCNTLKEKGLMENPNLVFNEEWFKKGLNEALFVRYSLMNPNDANQFVNQTKLQIKDGTADYDNITFNEKINYALGLENGKILKDFHLGENTKNDEIKELLAGLESGLNKLVFNDDKLQKVSELGKTIGYQLKSNKNFFKDSTLNVDYKLIRLGLINGITDFKGEFSAESARNYFISNDNAVYKSDKNNDSLQKEIEYKCDSKIQITGKLIGVYNYGSPCPYTYLVIIDENGEKLTLYLEGNLDNFKINNKRFFKWLNSKIDQYIEDDNPAPTGEFPRGAIDISILNKIYTFCCYEKQLNCGDTPNKPDDYFCIKIISSEL